MQIGNITGNTYGEEEIYKDFIEKLKGKTKYEDGCWLWQGARSKRGYGVVRFESRNVDIHRLSAYIFLNLNISNKTELALHKCLNTNCWNPEHLYIGTQKENMQDRTEAGNAYNGNTYKTHCNQGHEFTEENTYIDKEGHRYCRTCNRIRNEQYRNRRNKDA